MYLFISLLRIVWGCVVKQNKKKRKKYLKKLDKMNEQNVPLIQQNAHKRSTN